MRFPKGVIAWWQYACRQGHSTRYLRVPRLAEEIRTLRAAGTYSKWLAQLAKTQVLVLDDWGLVGLDALTREALMEILDDRAGRLEIQTLTSVEVPTILTAGE